ncbi:SHC-transforming protein 1 [Bacillus rossius redtenbacheri]|uniref:SHC-transforming protein 1 n=1 Tax=Bacillus rossius redtenbacheri TaxID=93214 RepID=UPI002FDCAA59
MNMPRPSLDSQVSLSNGSFISKPARGWLHPDQLITKEGITYAVRYIGCLEVNSSMKSLDFETRSQVAKECINRVCEAAGLKTADKKRKVDKRVLRAIGDQPIMDHAGANVNLSISSLGLVLTVLESGRVVARHDMPRISFASGGDTDTLDFVAYVAKDAKEWRACYVLECGGGLAADVITSIGQAFELRFQQFLTHPAVSTPSAAADRECPGRSDREYYNDLPGKMPPELGPPPVPPLPVLHSGGPGPSSRAAGDNKPGSNGVVHRGNVDRQAREVVTSNLIDLNCEAAPPPPILTAPPRREHDYVNDIIVNNRDVFDMQPFTAAVPTASASQKLQLQREVWFHGPVSRQDAEALLTKDGDFLVRESQGSPGQYVLTGMQNNIKKHLLLVDPEGVVRTKDRMFESVSHLINYHCENELPIISVESALVLRRPVHRTRQP